MDNANLTLTERGASTNANGSARRPSPTSQPSGVPGRPFSVLDSPNHPTGQSQIIRVIVNRDDKGYGMKVSGDNPVFVQSVKQGGAAEKAGLHAGDRIMEVNGVNVVASKHTEVVSLIRASNQVILTVQQKTTGLRPVLSPGLHPRPLTSHLPSQITGPQPVDNEKQFQLQLEREQHYRLMIEKEQRYLELLRSQIALSPNDKKCLELEKADRNLHKLQGMLHSHIRNNKIEQSVIKDLTDSPPLPSTPPPNILTKNIQTSNGNITEELPPPLPKRNRTIDTQNNKNAQCVNGEAPLREENGSINKGKNKLKQSHSENMSLFELGIRDRSSSLGSRFSLNFNKSLTSASGTIADNILNYRGLTPPPLPPRNFFNSGLENDGANSINKQLSYPLVATCATIINNYPPNHTHQRTKSSPESLLTLNPAEASKRMLASESMNDLSRHEEYYNTATPPGTPPPPYPSPLSGRKHYSNRNSDNMDDGDGNFEEQRTLDVSSTDVSPLRGSASYYGFGRILANSSPIHAATPQAAQQSIMSMEDEEISDQEVSQLEDHGPFKSLSRLWEHTPHLAVFMNYVILNSDPNSLLFYLITDLYKEGNAKEMRKWAYEIHSCFLVPGAPLRLGNIDESVAHEIDEVLQHEFDKEEILRKIFWKARNKAKEELTRQLVDFQQKRVAGLGTIFGPADTELMLILHDKAKELKLYESLFLEKVVEQLNDLLETENFDARKYYTAAAFTTVGTRVFGLRTAGHAHVFDRCPVFVNKEKSFRTKFMGRYSRKLNIQGHQFIAQQYYTVIRCNNCHQIIYGIGPQGYECASCHINLHRTCVKLYEDICPGPIKQKGMLKLMDRIRPENRDQKRKNSGHFIQMEKEKRMAEEKDGSTELNDSGETKPGNTSVSITRSGSDRRPDGVREESSKLQESQFDNNNECTNLDSTVSLPASTSNRRRPSSNINRSESVKEQSEKRKQRRNRSDPLYTTSETVDLDHPGGTPFHPNSGSSSNSSLSSRSSESPSSSLDAVGGFSDGQERDSDMEVETDPPDWQSTLTEEQLARLQPHEKKRQDVINELFHTERSHVRNLKVLEHIFRKDIVKNKALSDQELKLVFPNLVEILNLHNSFNTSMKTKRKENPIVTNVGEILLNMFDGDQGQNFCSAAAKFCENQQAALEFIKEKRKKDTRFGNVVRDCEKSNHCRRLPLQGFIPQEMQRLSKYPLLLERLIDSEEKALKKDPDCSSEELVKLRTALEKSREILNNVNEAASQAYNKTRLEEIKNHLDTVTFERAEHSIVNEFKNFDLASYTLIHEGSVILKRQNKTPIQVHMLLLEEAVILLHKEGERYILKFFHSSSQHPLAPIIRMPNIICRINAADKRALFIVSNTQHSQMYEIQCRDASERKTWFKYLTDASELSKMREGKSKRAERAHDHEEETVQELPPRRLETNEITDAVSCESENATSTVVSNDANQRNNEVMEDDNNTTDRISQSDVESTIPAVHAVGDGLSIKLTANEWPLIQPSEVQVAMPPVHTAEPVLTPLEQIKRKDEDIKKALAAKEILVADLLNIPRDEYHLIADIASDEATKKSPIEKELSEIVLAATYQVDKLLAAVNESLNISETDSVLATGGKNPSCTSSTSTSKCHINVPSVPVSKLQDIATTLNSHLTILLGVVKQRDEEKEKLRKELHRTREQLHEKLNLHGPLPVDEESTPPDIIPGDLECIEESPTETDTAIHTT